MPLFEYTGFNAAGKKVSGVIEAAGRRAGIAKLHEQGVYPTGLQEERHARVRGRLFAGLRDGRVPPLDLAAATRQLATLLGAGLALDEALATVADQLDHQHLRRILGRVRDAVVQGESLHGAMADHGRIFPPLYVNMVQVGESSGTLDQALARLADFLEDQVRLRSRVRSAMAYPVLMAVVGTGVLFFLFTFVVPKVTRMLTDLDQALPLPTRLLIGLSDALAASWWLLLLLLAVGVFLLYRYRQTERGRLVFDRLALRVPLFGRLNLLLATARFSRTLATLLASGVPLLKALEISRNLLQNRVLGRAVEETADAVREGESLAVPLRRSGVFPPMVAQMAAVGERSGELEGMLMRVADAYEHQVELAIGGLLSLLEPLMILVMGGAVGFIVLAILLPIFQASQGMG